jgi:hypothetical protein
MIDTKMIANTEEQPEYPQEVLIKERESKS